MRPPGKQIYLKYPADRAAILDGARALERVPELIGFGPHLLAIAILPATR
jgi:hypothetical protein